MSHASINYSESLDIFSMELDFEKVVEEAELNNLFWIVVP